METITIKRPASVTDAYGNTVPGALSVVATRDDALIAPIMKDEPVMVGRSAIEVNYNIYIRDELVDIRPDDVLTVRGEDVPVDGRVNPWRYISGKVAGTHIQVRLLRG